jgi:glycosyltransferase involved in cell wall biosynthesis
MRHAHSWYWRHTHERLSRAAFVYADAFVTGCELDQKYVTEHKIFESARTAVVEPGLDDEYLAMPFTEKKEHRVAYTGSWIARKGIDRLAAVMTEILSRDPKLRFDVYGTGGNREAVLAGFPASLHERIDVYGRLSNQQLAEAMARAKVFFFPSQYEGFGMALAEAMACSCAVITTRTGFGAELRDGQEALLYDFNDVEAMQQAILVLLQDEEHRLKIAQAGWQRVQTLGWNANIRRLEAVYTRWVSEFKQGAWRACPDSGLDQARVF